MPAQPAAPAATTRPLGAPGDAVAGAMTRPLPGWPEFGGLPGDPLYYPGGAIVGALALYLCTGCSGGCGARRASRSGTFSGGTRRSRS